MRRATIHFTKKEQQDLLLAWGVISLAFAILYAGGLKPDTDFAIALVVSALTVGIGFLLHELAHKFTALHYGCSAHFHANKKMLGLAVIFSFFGFVFAAPGAVRIQGVISKKQHGKIAAAGPITNLLLALLFIPLLLLGMPFAGYGAGINAFLALFNLLPIPGLDGSTVLKWDKRVYAGLLIISIGLSMLMYF